MHAFSPLWAVSLFEAQPLWSQPSLALGTPGAQAWAPSLDLAASTDHFLAGLQPSGLRMVPLPRGVSWDSCGLILWVGGGLLPSVRPLWEMSFCNFLNSALCLQKDRFPPKPPHHLTAPPALAQRLFLLPFDSLTGPTSGPCSHAILFHPSTRVPTTSPWGQRVRALPEGTCS